ncbi:very short patch repair endonuclease [Flavobacterium sp. ARAG 55.4]|uniref:very short patch repair endonuclease n=1 Tax=Flavobacterium sp. ARAG 55.4 TaxID=3451357 RepID=UPI003F4624B2
MDVHNPQQRSKNMRAIKSTATKAEIALAKALWNLGYRYRKNNKTVFGKPDLTFKKLKIAIFVDSEFFHGKDWETRKKPQTNAEFWIKKIERNMQRDIEVNTFLESQHWKVLRFWSNDIKNNLTKCIAVIECEIAQRKPKNG